MKTLKNNDTLVICPRCEGKKTTVLVDTVGGSLAGVTIATKNGKTEFVAGVVVQCETCKGVGKIKPEETNQ